jgi:hypothetical protein
MFCKSVDTLDSIIHTICNFFFSQTVINFCHEFFIKIKKYLIKKKYLTLNQILLENYGFIFQYKD